MKKALLFSICLMFGSFVSQAQNADAVRAEVTKMTTRYTLDADQIVEMERIQQRKQRNLTQIEVIKTQNPYLYTRKKQSIYDGTTASTKRLLKDKQLSEFQKNQIALRAARATKLIEAKEKKWSKLQIQAALLEVEEQFQ
jgi:hypothetical protein